MRLITLSILCILCGCKQPSLVPSEYVKWIENEENGLKESRTLNDFEFIAQYKPVDYVIAQEEQSDYIPEETYLTRKHNLEGFEYFNMIIRSADGRTPVLQNRTNPEGYYKRIQYFLSEARADFWLLQGGDTLDCTLCHFEQNYGIAPENTVVLVFKPRKTERNKKDLILVYDDKILGTGQVKIKIQGSSLDGLPQMQLN